MNGVPPAGPTFTTGRSEGPKFLSQSENDVAEAFAALLREEGIADRPSSPAPPPPSSSSSSTSNSSREQAAPSESKASVESSTCSPTNSSTAQTDRDREEDRDEESENLNGAAAVVVQPAPTAPPQEPTASGDEAESELEPVLSELRSLTKTLAGHAESREATESNEATPGGESSAEFAELLAKKEATPTAEAEASKDKIVAEAPPNVSVDTDAKETDGLRRAGSETPDGDEGGSFAFDVSSDDASNAEIEALTAIAAEKAAADASEQAPEAKVETKSQKERNDDREAAVASQAAAADQVASVVAPAPEAVASTTTSANPTSDAAAALQAASNDGRRDDASGSLLRTVERPREVPRHDLSGADRTRFLDRVERAFRAAEHGDGSIRMRLHPADLGTIQLSLERNAGGEWVARLEAESPEAKRLLLEHAGALRERLADQDFRVARFEVETPADRQHREAREFQEDRQSFSRGRDRRDDERTDEDRSGEGAPRAESTDGSRRLDVRV